MHNLVRIYRYINLLSIDVATGAVCCALFFARLLSVHILPFGLITLGLSVWIIYSVDHLLDARKVKTQASTIRHRFHQENFTLLVFVVAIGIVVNTVLIFFIRKPVFVGGIVLVLMVGTYLVLHRWINFPKEILIALLYTCGVLLPSVSVTTIALSKWPWILIVQFALTALLNLIIFSWFDQENDRRDGSGSFVLLAGDKSSRWVIQGLFVTNVVLFFFYPFSISSLVILSMNLILIGVFVKENIFRRGEGYRLIGDAVFFFPLIDWLLRS
jgi:4-hydroxybenzoate polyprenyltransferase